MEGCSSTRALPSLLFFRIETLDDIVEKPNFHLGICWIRLASGPMKSCKSGDFQPRTVEKSESSQPSDENLLFKNSLCRPLGGPNQLVPNAIRTCRHISILQNNMPSWQSSRVRAYAYLHYTPSNNTPTYLLSFFVT